MDHQFRPACKECGSEMSLMAYCDKTLEFVFECEWCDSEDAMSIKTDIKRTDFKKLTKLKKPEKREITISLKQG